MNTRQLKDLQSRRNYVAYDTPVGVLDRLDALVEALEDYYDPRGVPVKTVVKRWKAGIPAQENKIVDVPVRSLLPYREYFWDRKDKRATDAEWDALVASMARGFDRDYPLIIQVGRDGTAKIGEGNHRLAVAKELGMRVVPVRYVFQDRVTLGEFSHRRGLKVRQRALKKATADMKRREREEKEREAEEARADAEQERRIARMTPAERREYDAQVDRVTALQRKLGW